MLLQNDMTKVDTELSAPHTDPLDVVGAQLGWEGQHYVLSVSSSQLWHMRVSVVIELVLEWMRQDNAGPGAGDTLGSNPEEGVRTPTIIGEVLNEQLVLFGSEVHPAADSMQPRSELSQQSLDSGEVG